MPKKYYNLSEAFAEWVKKSARLPADHADLKEKVMGALRPVEKGIVRPIGNRKLIFASASLFAVVLLVGSSLFVNNRMQTATSSSAVRETSGETFGRSPGSEKFGALGSSPTAISRAVDSLQNVTKNFRTPKIDTREFLKTDYSAEIKTRTVEKLQRQIQTMIRGYGGRVDETIVSPRYGYVSFVIPKTALDSFTFELRQTVPPRFLVERETNKNLLPDKQKIEGETGAAERNLGGLEADRQKLINEHAAKVSSLEKKIGSYNYRIAALKIEMTQATTTERQAKISAQIAAFSTQRATYTQLLAQENAYFKSALYRLETSIANVNSHLVDLDNQDQALVDDVETVEGSISLEWISFFELLNLYVPIYWILGGLVIALVAGYVRYGRRRRFELP